MGLDGGMRVGGCGGECHDLVVRGGWIDGPVGGVGLV